MSPQSPLPAQRPLAGLPPSPQPPDPDHQLNTPSAQWLTKRDVRHDATPTQDGNPAVASLSERRDTFGNIISGCDFQYVAPERVGAFFSNHNRWFRFVF
ncbi:hypothetical protein HanRHA438_Chr09g0392991 [Helianthus annuus]|nr:hypothetical protein HanHA300_Chr09g0313031 [Helianthus annuus]KAJ0541911.1 hypothetical protein HanHA89_Chr09g0333951 [Helianthus annuus]KAJ0706979.1 hypothetical protein HanLR1_Chr09g0313331 [Helianthus annuus]KAJ0887622.1 hypothetical protein HanRHA438_Chr09g0392991 [Helianthus annuus]